MATQTILTPAVGILCVQIFLRVCASRSLVSGFPTTLERLPGDVVRVTVEVPLQMRWQPGHHAFLRMPSISTLDNHPFTVASVPTADPRHPNSPLSPNTNTLVFLIRARDGFTRNLALRTDADAALFQHPDATTPAKPFPRIRTLVDGPHGGHAPRLHRTADAVLLVAAGTGITAALPWVLRLAAAMGGEERGARLRVVRLVWIVRTAESVGWARRELEGAVARAGRARVVVDVYVTGGRTPAVPVVKKKIEGGEGGEERGRGCSGLGVLPTPPVSFRSGGSSTCGGGDVEGAGVGAAEQAQESLEVGGGLFDVHYGRPVLRELVPTLVSGRRAYVMGCGPAGMKVELANTVAELQLEMVVRARRMESIVLHTEDFGW
ncbi:hypothetical protein SLS57_001711 [Botryosphaeria dothidea]